MKFFDYLQIAALALFYLIFLGRLLQMIVTGANPLVLGVGKSGPEKAVKLKQLGVGVLICGAISRPLAEMINGSGIQVLPFVTGSTEQIMHAYKTGQLSQPQYTLPGSWPGARRGFRRRRRWKSGRR